MQEMPSRKTKFNHLQKEKPKYMQHVSSYGTILAAKALALSQN